MTPYYTDDWLTVWQGDCREVMAQMPAESVHCVVTSPPYWGLRDYGTATWLGGDDGCDHRSPTMREGRNEDRATLGDGIPATNSAQLLLAARTGCGKCGAVRQDSQLGLEPTPEEYVANMVAVFREVRRVLRADGTCWVNLGDSYTSKGEWPDAPSNQGDSHPGISRNRARGARGLGVQPKHTGLKPKDLVGIPWRVAFALQADGWYLRSDIIWSKPNPMPESVTDRPTKAHEYLFLLSKSARYYWDADAVSEADAGTDHNHRNVLNGQPSLEPSGGISGAHRGIRTEGRNGSGRNIRSVWSIATQPYPRAHFATFPEKLVEPCVKAGTSERGVCPECGAPWRRVVERGEQVGGRIGTTRAERTPDARYGADKPDAWQGGQGTFASFQLVTTGWQPSCAHRLKFTDTYGGEITPVPAVVLDPFAGSGTTGRVAQRLGRRAVLIDLSGEYLVQAMKRNTEIPLGLESA